MVSVKYNNRRLVPLFHRFHKITGKLIHFIHFVHIILPGIAFSLVFHSAHHNLRVLNHLLRRIIPMALHTDGKHKVLLFCRIHGIHDIRDQDIVRSPSLGRSLENIHKLFARIMVKPHVVEPLGAAVEVTAVIVQRLCTISKLTQRGSCAFQYFGLCVCFIGIFPRAEETHAHPRQHLKLCIRRSCANGRNLKVTGRMLLIHLSQIRDRIFRKLEPLYLCRVKVGFQLHKYNIRKRFFIPPGGTLCNTAVVAYLSHGLFAVACRL